MTAKKVIETALSQLGIKENPAGSNKVKYNTDYYGRAVSGSAYPWCCVFIWWVFKESGASSLFYGGEKTAYCPTVETYYRKHGQWHMTNPQPGDLVLFDFTHKGLAGHIGILEKMNADGTCSVIEGNTSASNDANGGCVMRRARKLSVIRGFARPNYSGASSITETTAPAQPKKEGEKVTITLTMLRKGAKGNEVKTLQRLLIALGYSCGSYGADGDFGSATYSAVTKYQKAHGLEVDGIVGEKTWESILKKA